jgi:hypothetical protein
MTLMEGTGAFPDLPARYPTRAVRDRGVPRLRADSFDIESRFLARAAEARPQSERDTEAAPRSRTRLRPAPSRMMNPPPTTGCRAWPRPSGVTWRHLRGVRPGWRQRYASSRIGPSEKSEKTAGRRIHFEAMFNTFRQKLNFVAPVGCPTGSRTKERSIKLASSISNSARVLRSALWFEVSTSTAATRSSIGGGDVPKRGSLADSSFMAASKFVSLSPSASRPRVTARGQQRGRAQASAVPHGRSVG